MPLLRPSPRLLDSWSPAAGASAIIGYARNAHPRGLMATAEELAPKYQPWGTSGSDNAPWEGSPTPYGWQTYQNWSGGCWDQAGRRFIEYGGGHVSINVPAPSAFNVGNLAYEWLAVPLETDGLGSAADPPSKANTASAYGDKWDADESCWLGDSSGFSPNQPGVIQPEPQHSQYGLVWIPGYVVGNGNGIVLNCTSPTGKYGGAVDLQQRTYFDLADNKWKLCANFQRSDIGYYAGAAVWFGGSVNRAFALQSASSTVKTAIQNFNPATKTWAETDATGNIDVVYGCGGLVAHLDSGLLISFLPSTSGGDMSITGGGSGAVQFRMKAVSAAAVVAGSHTWTLLTYTNLGGTWPLSNISGTRENFECLGAVYCPVNGCVYIYDWRYNSATLWKITPSCALGSSTATYLAATWAISTETFSGPIPNLDSNGATGLAATYPYNRLFWDSVSGCLVGVPQHYLQPPFAIKPSGI